ncbi:hypothetical protein BaRGS_00015210 [Batillaria attramentaria]|uniref:Uncharacterized protein n=1 Tax=Batillaria attramentaria TaxID=370345 RepID=A0ABD0L1X6_9CAEN
MILEMRSVHACSDRAIRRNAPPSGQIPPSLRPHFAYDRPRMKLLAGPVQRQENLPLRAGGRSNGRFFAPRMQRDKTLLRHRTMEERIETQLLVVNVLPTKLSDPPGLAPLPQAGQLTPS